MTDCLHSGGFLRAGVPSSPSPQSPGLEFDVVSGSRARVFTTESSGALTGARGVALPSARHPSENQERTLPLTPHFQVPCECPMEGPAAQAGPRQLRTELAPGQSYAPGPEWREGGRWARLFIWVPLWWSLGFMFFLQPSTMAHPGLPLGDLGQMSSRKTQFGAGQRVPLHSTAPASRVFGSGTGANTVGSAMASSPRQMGVSAHVGWNRDGRGRKKVGRAFTHYRGHNHKTKTFMISTHVKDD